MLPLPVSPLVLLREVIDPALRVLPYGMATPAAKCMLIAIAIQESDLADRRQGTEDRPGPARGLSQFERIGVAGVLQHAVTDDLAAMVCRHHGLPVNATAVHKAMEFNDELGFQFARLNLWTDRERLPPPTVSNEDEAFDLYLRVWRPGAANTPAGRAKCALRWRRAWKLAVRAVG